VRHRLFPYFSFRRLAWMVNSNSEESAYSSHKNCRTNHYWHMDDRASLLVLGRVLFLP
jgi:hypothetical protein